ncbi:uncharacterized protein BDR25DRAFT_124048 [Lindgomyces ingoldianus]|uniref:Uncharacterized protein n=1 Tax=Lindgomyces ingoldianus TaxID=673940 RepID=A0ACB6R3F5_9PLEO|nr:uncharacterized protein BDR25DRAFT_124048 [Lindgomyces ingoldianus]KAF2473597.1 hypothetical protein BDR25DRAFT_124048 [Lindgomyces ingoldianus]
MLTQTASRHLIASQSPQQATRTNDPSRGDAIAQVEDPAEKTTRMEMVLQEILRQRSIALQCVQTKSESTAQDSEAAQTESSGDVEQCRDLEDLQDDFSSIEFERFPQPEHIRPRPMKKVKSYTGPVLCYHQGHWDQVGGRWRCEHCPGHRLYRTRHRCPGCNTVACGNCLKKTMKGYRAQRKVSELA